MPNHSSNIRIPLCVIHTEMLSTQFSQNPTHMYHPFVPSTRVYHVHRFVIRTGVPSAQVCHLLSCVMNIGVQQLTNLWHKGAISNFFLSSISHTECSPIKQNTLSSPPQNHETLKVKNYAASSMFGTKSHFLLDSSFQC